MSTYKIYDVVVVPFPFTDKQKTKNRPALVISKSVNKTRTLAMITSSGNPAWPYDVEVEDLEVSGLKVSCRVRMKLFTIDELLIKTRIGNLGSEDRGRVRAQLVKYLEPCP